jgi:hypothetical protein
MTDVAKKQRRALAKVNPASPGDLGFPPGLAIELAMGLNTPQEVCEGYGFSKDDFARLCGNPLFQSEFKAMQGVRAQPDGLFRLQAKLMAMSALDEQFKLMKNPEVAIRLKAAEDLIDAAGTMPEKKVAGSADAPTFAIQINLG